MTSFFVVSVLDVVHALSGSKDILDGKVHWVVEETFDGTLIWSNVGWVSIEAFTHLEDTGSISILSPEIFWYLWNSVNSNSIKVEVLDEVLDPVLKEASDIVIFMIDIWKTSESTVFNLPLVGPVIDAAVVVVMLGLVEWVQLAEIVSDWGGMVCYNIDHYGNSHIMGSLDQVLEIIIISKMAVPLGPVLSPISMIAWVEVINDW